MIRHDHDMKNMFSFSLRTDSEKDSSVFPQKLTHSSLYSSRLKQISRK
jgi:hypothetical protein